MFKELPQLETDYETLERGNIRNQERRKLSMTTKFCQIHIPEVSQLPSPPTPSFPSLFLFIFDPVI